MGWGVTGPPAPIPLGRGRHAGSLLTGKARVCPPQTTLKAIAQAFKSCFPPLKEKTGSVPGDEFARGICPPPPSGELRRVPAEDPTESRGCASPEPPSPRAHLPGCREGL